MLIQCRINRIAGTVVTLEGSEYHFLRSNGNITEVNDEDHAKILLSIPEGYQLVKEGTPASEDEQESTQQENPKDKDGRENKDVVKEEGKASQPARRGRKPKEKEEKPANKDVQQAKQPESGNESD